MLDIFNVPPAPSDIGGVIPSHVIEAAGGADGLATFRLGPGLKVHRRRDDIRVRRPVNGRRGFVTLRYASTKNHGKDVHSESTGEFPMFAMLEIHPSIVAYRDQPDLVEFEDEDGRHWATPDAFAVLLDGTPVWIEGKYATAAVRDPRGFPQLVVGIHRDLKRKLGRIQRAFAAAGFAYVVVNQSWCRQPTIARNVNLAFWSRHNSPDLAERDRLAELLAGGPTTVAECRRAFPDRVCPEEWVCAAMARGLIEIDVRKPFGGDSVVTVPGEPFWCNGRGV
jgi:hypothetical protein